MPDYGNPDLYRSPRYSPLLAEELKASVASPMWDDWDLSGLLTDVPKGYALKMGVEHGIFCSTGTAGLHASLMALPLKPTQEVIAPCMTFIRAVTPMVHLGLVPVLADIDPLTGNIDPASLEAMIGPQTRAVIVVHMWGIPADMAAITEICQRRGLYLVEDFSHAHFTQHADGVVGGFGDVAFASLQRKKTLSVGEGGIVVTRNPETYARLRQITSPGSFKGTENYNEFSGFGLNFRMSPFSGVVARHLLDRAEAIVAARAQHAREFDTLLSAVPDMITPPTVPDYARLVSAYGYKPRLAGSVAIEALMALNTRGRWRFGPFTYDDIVSSPFWTKSAEHYPFALGIQPRVAECYPGYTDYTRGRVSLSVPTVPGDYWTLKQRELWAEDLRTITP